MYVKQLMATLYENIQECSVLVVLYTFMSWAIHLWLEHYICHYRWDPLVIKSLSSQCSYRLWLLFDYSYVVHLICLFLWNLHRIKNMKIHVLISRNLKIINFFIWIKFANIAFSFQVRTLNLLTPWYVISQYIK